MTTNFEKLFQIKNSYTLLGEMNAVAIRYYNEVMARGTDDLEELKYFLLCLDRLYQEGFESPLRDEEYDDIHEYYIDRGGDVIRGDMSSSDKAVHVYPDLKGTIRKVHFVTEEDRLRNSKVKSQKSLETWLKSVISTLKDAGVLGDTLDLGFYTKFDGLSVVLEIEDGVVKSAITRGDKDTGEGQDKTRLFENVDFKKICDALHTSKIGLKCEALVSTSLFPEYNKRFGASKLIDERTAATSILNNEYPSEEQLSYLTLMPLMVEYNGRECPLPPNSKYCTEDEHTAFEWLDTKFPFSGFELDVHNSLRRELAVIKELIDHMHIGITKYIDYPADGIVVRVLNEEYQKILGRNVDDCVNNWERAYKFPPAKAKTVLTGIAQEIGLLGKVSFTAKVEPVKLKGKTIKSISIGSLDRMQSLGLAVGDEVIVQYDIIPYLTVDETCSKSGEEPIPVIRVCPMCGEELKFVPELSCVNNNCPSRIVGKVYNFCSKLGMDGIGPATVETLYWKGQLKCISDLYRLDKAILMDICQFGPVESKNILKSINKVKEVDDYVFLGSLGIPSVSRKTFEKVLSKIDFKDLITMPNDRKSIKTLTTVKGIKSKTARRILTGLEDMKGEIEILLSHLKLRKARKYTDTVCFTKIRDRDFEKYLNSIGVGVTEDITRNTTVLIAGGTGSGKYNKAVKWKVPIMTIDDAYKKFGYTSGK